VSDTASTSNETGAGGLSVVVVGSGAGASRARRALEAEGVRVLATAPSASRAESAAGSADAVVLQLPDRDSTGRVAEARVAAPDARLVALVRALTVRQLRALLDAGVDAVVLDEDAPGALGPAVRAACAGQVSIPRSLRQTFVTPVLSNREKQVLGLVVLGLSNSEIARKLHLSESTVNSRPRSRSSACAPAARPPR
jgi:DNA-binding NarL/FixJ family response regulator